MLNTTTRLAVSIRNLPPWEFSWDDTTPQKSRHELTVEDILPGPDDGAQFFDRAVAYTMEILVETFPSLKDLAQFITTRGSSASTKKSVVIPQELLFRDEKYTDENIHILRQYIKDCKFRGNPQVHNFVHSAIYTLCITYILHSHAYNLGVCRRPGHMQKHKRS